MTVEGKLFWGWLPHYDLFSFGWHNRHVNTVALYEALANIELLYEPTGLQEHFRQEVEPPCALAILSAKIFAEYVAQLETFGVLCHAIAKHKQQSIMWTYLNAESGSAPTVLGPVLATSGIRSKNYQLFLSPLCFSLSKEPTSSDNNVNVK